MLGALFSVRLLYDGKCQSHFPVVSDIKKGEDGSLRQWLGNGNTMPADAPGSSFIAHIASQSPSSSY